MKKTLKILICITVVIAVISAAFSIYVSDYYRADYAAVSDFKIEENISITTKKATFIRVNNQKYFFECPGYKTLYSLKVIRLARDAINVPAPPILTPIKRCA